MAIRPNRFRTHTCGELRAEDAGQTIVLSGWVSTNRDMGGVVFIDLRDKYGVTQVVFDPQRSGAIHAEASKLRSDWVVRVEGRVRVRPVGNRNAGLATGEIRSNEWLRVVWLEFRVGLTLGVCYGVVVGGFAHLLYGVHQGWIFSMVVALGMMISMTVASSMGALEPFIFRHFGIDPATATGPLITTITDLIATSAYLALATVMLLR